MLDLGECSLPSQLFREIDFHFRRVVAYGSHHPHALARDFPPARLGLGGHHLHLGPGPDGVFGAHGQVGRAALPSVHFGEIYLGCGECVCVCV